MSAERRPNVFGLSRDIWDHPLFADERFSEREAWMWLVGAAAWKDIRVRGVAGVIDLKRGEFSFSVRFLAEKWGWTKSSVDRFIGRLEDDAMIRDTCAKASKVYFINNYNRYQVVGVPKSDDPGTPMGQARDKDGTGAGQARDKEEAGETVKQGKQEEEIAASAASPSQPDLLGDIPEFLDRRPKAEVVELVTAPVREVEKAFEAYNLTVDFVKGEYGCELPRATTLNDARRRGLHARLKDAGGLPNWLAAMRKIAQSSFLRGENDRNWRLPGLDWVLKPANFTKIVEGNYDDKPHSPQGRGSSTALGRLAAAAAIALADDPYGD